MRNIIIIAVLSFTLLLRAQSSSLLTIENITFGADLQTEEINVSDLFPLSEGTTVTLAQIDAALKEFEKVWQNRGYLFARIDSAQFEYNQDSTGIRLRISGHHGKRVRFGAIEIRADSLDAERYATLLRIKRENVYNKALLEGDINTMLEYAADRGFPFASATVDRIRFDRTEDQIYADILIRLQEGARVHIKDIIISGNAYTRDYVIRRELPIKTGDRYASDDVREISRRLNRLQMFKSVRPPQIYTAGSDSVYIKVTVEEGNATSFDGVVGYVPLQQESRFNRNGYFTGLIDLTFNNLFGTGRRFLLHWKKPDQFSEEFYTTYTEPWILGYPIDVSGGLERVVRDTTFIQWQTDVSARMQLLNRFALLASVKRKVVTPDSLASRHLRLLNTRTIHLEGGLEYDSRDYIPNPREGIYYKSTYSYGFKNNAGPSYIINADSIRKTIELQTVQVHLGWFRSIWRNQVFAFELHGKRIEGDQLQISDFFWFGGSRSMRGYREDQFRGDLVAWSNLEYRFLFDRDSRLFVFNDWGYYRRPQDSGEKTEWLAGYGAGIRFRTPLGILGVDYGLAKGEGFGQGKIHFGIINRF